MTQDTAPPAGSVAVVTGGARRVGREIVLSLVRRGLSVVIHHGTSSVEANVLVQQITGQGGKAVAVSADLRILETRPSKFSKPPMNSDRSRF